MRKPILRIRTAGSLMSSEGKNQKMCRFSALGARDFMNGASVSLVHCFLMAFSLL